MRTSKTILMMIFAGCSVFAQAAPDFEAHEWGTFTSVFGSDGTLLSGLYAEEETLPPFVHSHGGMDSVALRKRFKGFYRDLKNVTVKMETPVVYFYSDTGFRAHVAVGFENGSISQWYPSRSGGETPPKPIFIKEVDPMLAAAAERSGLGTYGKHQIVGGAIDFAKPYRGAIKWDVDVLPPSPENDSRVFRGSETLTWTHPRMTDSNVVRSDSGEHEKYLFYRGLGNFESLLQPRFVDDDRLLLSNAGKDPVSAWFLFHHEMDGSVSLFSGSDLKGRNAATVDLRKIEKLEGDWKTPVYDTFVKALVREGLFQKEADAMIRTWWNSYFEKPGLRVFWMMPVAELDERLPLKISPNPRKTVRVMVGRSEVLSPEFERALLAAEGTDEMNSHLGHHFVLAYMERLKQLKKNKVAVRLESSEGADPVSPGVSPAHNGKPGDDS